MHSVLTDFRAELTSNINILMTLYMTVASLHLNVTLLKCLHFLLSGCFMAERFVKPVLSKSPERYNHHVKK